MEKKEKDLKKKKSVKAKKNKIKKEGLFSGVWHELDKVKWPTAREMAKYTFATLLFCVLLALFFQGIDLLASFIKGLF